MKSTYKPQMTKERLSPTFEVEVTNQFNKKHITNIAGESALTILVDGKELVTLMTLGTYPEELSLGYLRNQRLIENLSEIESITVDWEKESAEVTTRHKKGISNLEARIAKRIITTGCGQGTVFSCSLDKLYEQQLPSVKIKQSVIYSLLRNISQFNEIYITAGGVHGCALCRNDEVLLFVEDVGRHNAADAIAGMMWLEDMTGEDKIFYTTGRLTSEIVMKTSLMRIPILLSRSGITFMGLDLAKDLNVTMIARAKTKSFCIYTNCNSIIYDAIPK